MSVISHPILSKPSNDSHQNSDLLKLPVGLARPRLPPHTPILTAPSLTSPTIPPLPHSTHTHPAVNIGPLPFSPLELQCAPSVPPSSLCSSHILSDTFLLWPLFELSTLILAWHSISPLSNFFPNHLSPSNILYIVFIYLLPISSHQKVPQGQRFGSVLFMCYTLGV